LGFFVRLHTVTSSKTKKRLTRTFESVIIPLLPDAEKRARARERDPGASPRGLVMKDL